MWDPAHFQQSGGGGGPTQQQAGGVKLFDPTQFQPQHQQPQQQQLQQQQQQQLQQQQQQQQHPQEHQQQQPVYPSQPGGGTFYPPAQPSTWDNWGNWNWNTEGQTAPLTGQAGGQAGYTDDSAGQRQGQGQLSSQPGQQTGDQTLPHQPGQFYNPQVYHTGTVPATDSAAGSHGDQAIPSSQHQWGWYPDQSSQAAAPQEQAVVSGGSPQTGPGQFMSNQGQYFYQGQQAYYDPSAWSNTDPTQVYGQWGSGPPPQPQPSAEQEAGQVVPHSEGAVIPSSSQAELPVNSHGSGVDIGSGMSTSGGGLVSSPPTVDISSHTPVMPASQGQVSHGHAESRSSTRTGFYSQGDNQPQAAAAAAAAPPVVPLPMQHLQVKMFQRTDSGISNASLQTVNMSGDEDAKDSVDEVTGQMSSLQLDSNQVSRDTQQGDVPLFQHHAGPGDFSGFGTYSLAGQEVKASQEGALSSGSGESDQQSPMMNDWEIVPPQAHSSTSHSRNDSLDDGLSFVNKQEESRINPGQAADGTTQAVPQEGTPAASQSAMTQDSESFTAISSTSSGDTPSSVPFSQGSGYYPTASSTPLTSPGAQSLQSQPSSLPSWQGSPQLAPGADVSLAPVSAPPHTAGQETTPPRQQKSKKPGDRSKASEESLYSSALSNKTAVSSKHSPGKDDAAGLGRPPPSPISGDGGQLSSPSRRHQSAFHPVHSQRAKQNMSPATTLWDNADSTPPSNILLAPAAPLIIPSLGNTATQSSNTSSVETATSKTTTKVQPLASKALSSSNTMESREGGKKAEDKESGKNGGNRRAGERTGLNKSEELSRSRDEDSRSLGSLDELDAAPMFTDDPYSRGDRNRGYGRDPRYDSYPERPSSRSDNYGDDYRRYREPYRGYGYRDPYYDERYDRPRSRQDEERSSRPSSRSAREVERPRSRTDYERDRDSYAHHRDPYRGGGYSGYEGYDYRDYYYDDRDRYYRYQRDWRYRHGYAEEMGQYYEQQQRVDSRYPGYYGPTPPVPPPSRYPQEDHDHSSVGSLSRGNTPALDDADHSVQDYYSRSSRPPSRSDRDPYRQGYSGYGSGYGSYGGGYYDQYQYQYPYYNYPQQYGEQQQQLQSGGYQQGRMTPPKYLLPHVRVCFGATGQLVTVLPTRPAEGQPATVEIHSLESLLSDNPQLEELKSFPGPLVRNETHKNDVLLFCQTRAKQCSDNVDMLDRDSAQLVWRLLELLIKQNGTVIGTDIADLLLSGHEPSTHDYAVSGLRVAQNQSWEDVDSPDREADSGASSPAVRTSTDRTVVTATQQLEDSTDRFRHLLLYGRKKEALDWAMKRNLWGHALFLASKMDNRTHANVMTRFANTAMRMNDPLQTLYQLMSGRQPAAVTSMVDERWGDWRPHLAMILSNHSSRAELDKKSIMALGDTLATKHCLHASQFCYLMAQVDFGSFGKKASKIVLIGSNHNLPLEEFCSSGAIQCTEVYEYAQSLGNSKFSLPPFQLYKLLYACRLVDCGFSQEAFHYFEVIALQVLQNPARFLPGFISVLYSLASQLKHSDPQKLQSGDDATDPAWLTQLSSVCHSYEEGAIQYKSGSATPMTGYGGQTPSSESGEMAGYAMDASSANTAGGFLAPDGSCGYQTTAQLQHAGAAQAGQQQYTGADQYGQYSQYSQPVPGDQQAWQQQQQQAAAQVQPQQATQQQYSTSQHQQQPWQGGDYTQGYGTTQPTGSQQMSTGYYGNTSQQGSELSSSQHQHQQQQPHQQQQQHHHQQPPNQYNYGSYAPQQRPSVTSFGSTAEPTEEEEEDDDDDEEEEGEEGGAHFDYFGAASQQKIVVPPSRYRTTSTSSTSSTGQRRRRRTTSGSSTGSVRAANSSKAPPPRPADSKAKNSQQKNDGGGWLGGFFSKFSRGGKNEMKLPDDKNPSIVWDSAKKTWVNKDGDAAETPAAVPPPKDADLLSKLQPPGAPGPVSAPAMNGPPTMNRFTRQRGRGARGQYVDVLNPGGQAGGQSTAPPTLFSLQSSADTSVSQSGATSVSSQSTVAGSQGAQAEVTPHELSRSSSLSSLSREIQQLTMKAQQLGGGDLQPPPDSSGSQPAPGMPMMFNPAQLSQTASKTGTATSRLKHGHSRIYPK